MGREITAAGEPGHGVYLGGRKIQGPIILLENVGRGGRETGKR